MTPLALQSAAPFSPETLRTAPRCTYRYDLHPLGLSPEGTPIIPVSLNDRGDLLTYTAPPLRHEGDRHVNRGIHSHHDVVLRAATTENTLPFAALATNGLVAGSRGDSYRKLRAWASHLGTFGEDLWPDTVSLANGINEAGHVIGQAYIEVGMLLLSRAFVVSPEGRGRFLTPPGGGTTVAAAINDEGDILLNATSLGAFRGQTQAWLYRHGNYIPLGDLGSGQAEVCYLTPGGCTIGSSRTASGQQHAFLVDGPRVTDIGTLPGYACEAAAGNDHGTVVGHLTGRQGERRAFHWCPTRGLETLLDLVPDAAKDGWSFKEAVAINRAGTIAVIGQHHGEPAGALLHPTH